MKTCKKIIITSLLFLVIFSVRNVSAMTFAEYQIILEKAGINLTPEQESVFQNFFEKKNPTKTYTKNRQKKSLENVKDFSEFTYILKNGITDTDTNGMVSKLQALLQNKGFSPGIIDGYYGPQTIKAVENLKAQKNITNTAYGIFNPSDFLDYGKGLKPMHLFLATDEVFFYNIPKRVLSQNSTMYCNNEKISVIEKGDEVVFPLTFPYYTEKPFHCEIKNEKYSETFLTVHKKENKKLTSYANITTSNTYNNISNKNEKRIADEKVLLQNLYEMHAGDKAYFNEPFMLPLDTKMTSPFGKTRIMNGKVSSFHSGTDFRAPTPREIKSANNGIVMFVGDLFYCGKTIIINHGMDIFTAYCHLSSIYVEQGQKINKGDIIGMTGNTGRTSGPHLHLSSKFEGKYMDFMSMYENSKILK